VAWWRAEGDALDAISTNNGVLTNGTGFAAGEVGLAFLFNGKTNYVQVGTNASLNFSNAMTFEGWIFPTGPGSDPTSGGTIISKEYQYEIARWADGTIRFAFANHTPGWNWVSSGYIAPLNQWTHIAVVYNGGAVSTYANGLLVNSYAGVGAIGVYSQGQNDFRIGGRQAISEYFQGQIDEASVYNRALSGAEVALIYNAGGAGKVSTGPYFVTPPALPDGIVNQAYSQIISSARGAAPVTYSIVSGNLPPGLSLNSGGVLSGAPTSTGSFSFTVSATDNAGAVNSQVFTLSIYASVLPPPGLISWWRAENNAVDSVGTNSGTLVNGAGFAQGVAGQAFAFTGYSSQSVAIPDSASLHPASVTLESWVMLRNPLPGYVTEAGILRKAVGSGYSNSYAIWLAEGGGGSGQNGSLNAQVGNDSAVGAALSYPFNPAPGVWFHVAYTFDDTTKQQTLYLNGNPVGSSTANLSIGYDNGSLALGSIGSQFGNYYLDGRMDETAIYSRALSANEIAAIYNAGSSGMTPTGPYFSTPPALPNGVVNQAYSQTFAIIHAAAPVTYSLGMSTLPPGLTLSSAGVLSGIPTTNGSFSFTVSATDNAALTGSQVFTLQVYAPVNPTSGLISWWRAEGNALDSIGTNNGTLVNGAIFGPGMAGQGFAFNGVNQSVDIPDSASLHPAAVTLEAWVIYAANNKYQVLFAKALGTGTLDSYTLWLDASGYLNGGVSDTSGFGPVLAAPYPLTPGQWYHVAFVFDNTSKQQSLYINGVLSAINVANKSIAYDSNVLSLGRDSENTAGAYFLNGRMDEAAIYGRALSANELAAIYNAGSAGKTTSGPYFSTPPALPIGILNVAYSQAFASARATPPVTYSLVSGTLPTGITLSSAGLLSGIPTSTGIFSFTVAATDNALLSNSQLFTLQVLTPLTPASLVGWWRAEGNAADSIGTNNGALANGTTFAPGLVGQAFLFNGTNQSVDIPDAPALRPASVTLEAWVMFLANSGFQTIFGKGLGNGALDSLSVWLDSAGTLNGEICDTVAASAISVPLLPTLGQWYHIAFTFDDSTHLETLYVNGSEAIGGVALKSIAYDSTPLTIGRDTDGGGPKYFLSGLVDEASIYNRALTGSEIASIFSAGAAGKASAGPYFVTGPSLSNAFIGQSYTQTFATARGVSPVSYALIQGQIPPGMSLNPAGILSGVPTSSGQFVFTIQATDFATQVAIQSFTLNVFRQVPLSPGLVAWWRGEGNALDSAGTNNGTLVGGVTFASGEFGQAFSLNGASGFIKIPDAPALRPPSFTLQCWAQFNSAGGQQALLAKPFGSGVADSFIFYLNNGVLDGGLTAASLNYSDITYPFVPIEGRWYHLAFSFNALSGQEALYVDGVQVANQLTTLTVGYGTNSMILGADNDNGSPTLYLNGRIDEVCVYNRELSPAEIASFWTTDVPNLSIAPAGLNLLNLFWPATGNFTLQQSSDLVSGIWTDSYYPISSNNGTNGVTIAPTTGNLFFRLRQ
jgi:hypothetical protein